MKLWFVRSFLWLLGLGGAISCHAGDSPAIAPGARWDARTREKIQTAQNLVGDIRRQAATNGLAVESLKTKLNGMLQGVPHAFQLLKPATNAAGPVFQKLTLNQNTAGLDGFRIKNTSSLPKKLTWACAFKASSLIEVWYILPVQGTMQGFSKYFLLPPDLKNVPWKDAGRPYKAFCQSLETAELQPGEEYIVWLSFTSSRPQEIYVLFDLVPGDFPTGDVKEILKVLGIN